MARDAMPPMVVSADRYLDIEPYGNRLRASNPIKWGSIFPWEFPQTASRQQEEDFLRQWFSAEEIHVQGGAGDDHTSGRGFKFLKQVWYSQAIWNWEQRVPALSDWWWKNAESAGLIHGTSMQKYILDPNVELKTFFQSKELEMYGEKFLWHVVPLIQQTARLSIEEKDISEKKVQITRTVARVPETISASEPPTATLDGQANLPDLAKVSSQPADAKSKMISPAEAQHAVPHSAVSEFARPRTVSDDQQGLLGQPPLARKRGFSGSGRYHNRGGHFQSRQPFHHHEQQMPPSMQAYRSASRMQYQANPQFVPGGPPDFAPRGRGQPSFADGPPPFAGAYRFPTIDAHRHPSTFATPFDGQQPNIIWAPSPLLERSNHVNASYDALRDNGPGPRGGYGQGFQGRRGRVYSGDRGRGRGGRGGRNSSGSHGQAPVQDRWTSYEFKGLGSAAKARRTSNLSDERNWRSGSEHPQKDTQSSENMMPVRPNSQYVPTRDNNPFHTPPYHPEALSAAPSPPGGYDVPQPHALPDGLRYHCTQKSIGDLCPYVTKLTTFIPQEINDSDALHFFKRFGHVMNFYRFAPSSLRPDSGNPLPDQLAFITFATADEARHCMNNKPETWPFVNRPLRIEIPKEYWDSAHPRYWINRAVSANMAPAVDLPYPSTYGPMQGAGIMHQSHDSSSTIRAPLPHTSVSPEPQDASGETTPTASGTNTPKKKNRPVNKKNKNKQNKDLCTVGEETNDIQSKPGESTATQATERQRQSGSVEEKVIILKPDLTVEVEKQRSASESTERQTTSEPSMTPVDKVTAKLPNPKSTAMKDKEDSPVSSVARIPSESTSVQTSAEPFVTPADSASVNLPSDACPSDQSFREHEAETEALPTDMMSRVEDQRVKTSGPTDGDAALPSKSEEEPFDDSFHTATGSPSSGKFIGGSDAAENMSTEATKAASGNDAPRAMDKAKLVHAEVSPKDNEEVPNETSSLAIDTEPATNAQKRKAKRSASEGSALVPPAAFVTAPNTPVVEQAADRATPAEDAEPTQPKKPERMKGPSKTESLSMFGKKQKKSRPDKKKVTLKRKPKGLEAASSDPSDPLPAPSKPTAKARDGASTARTGEDQNDARSPPVPSTERKDSNAGVAARNAIDGCAPAPQNLEGIPPSMEEETVKRRGPRSILENIRGLFTGSQTQSNLQEEQSTEGTTTKNPLADVKSKKKKGRAKNKSKETTDNNNTTPCDTSGSKDVRQDSSTSHTFRFTFESDTPGFSASAHSDNSPNTMGDATPSTGTSSPTMMKQPRRLRLNGSTSGSVLHEKEPLWKNKKRTYRGVSGPEESADEEGKTNYALEKVDSKSSAGGGETVTLDVIDTATTGQSSTKNDNDGENGENEIVKESKAKMKRLMEEESSRKHGLKGSKAGTAGKVTEGERSRIEELN